MLHLIRGSVGGGALATDGADPNGAGAPANTATVRVSPRTATQAVVHAVSGTTCTITLWGYEPTLGRWIQLYTGLTVTPAAPVFRDIPHGVHSLYPQITANTGVEVVGVSFVG